MPPLADPLRYIHGAVALARSGRSFVFFDTETTGLYRNGEPAPAPWQIAAVRREPDKMRTVGSRILRVGMDLPPRVCEVCHVAPDYPERRGRDAAEVLLRFAAFVGDSILVGHNSVGFDNRIMADAYKTAGLPVPLQFTEVDLAAHLASPRHSIDTKHLAQAILVDCLPRNLPTPRQVRLEPGERGGLALAPLARYLRLPFDAGELHEGGADVALCERVFDELIVRGAAILRASGLAVPSKAA